MTTDGAGYWVAVWMSDDDLGGPIGTDHDILFSRSTDSGATWTDPFPLNSNAASDSGYDYLYNKLAADGQGNWVAVWDSSDDLGATIGTDYDIFFARSTDNGGTWTAALPLNTNAASDSGHDLDAKPITDGHGNWVVIWASHDDPDGTIGTDADLFFARSTDNGATWSTPALVNTNAASDSTHDWDVQMATDGQGHWVVVWPAYDDLGGTIGTDADILFTRFELHADAVPTVSEWGLVVMTLLLLMVGTLVRRYC